MTLNAIQPQDSMLLKLPAELRYKETLLHTEVIEVTDEYLRRPISDQSDDFKWQPPVLLQTCSQIRTEACSIYYSKNRFAIPRDGRWDCRLHDWLTALHVVDVASIRHVRITSTNNYSPEVSIAILKHLWKAFIEESGLALSKHALYATVKVWIDFNDSKLPYLVACVWLDLARLENATIQWGRVVVEDLEGLDQD